MSCQCYMSLDPAETHLHPAILLLCANGLTERLPLQYFLDAVVAIDCGT